MVRGIHPQGTYPVRSPSFTIVSEYPGPKPIYHIDLFRIGSGPGDAETGVEDLFGGDGFYLIEWADRCPHWLPAERLDVELEILGPSGRSLVFRTLGKRWREALKLLEAKIEETL
jgi:tRNA threonylcarbamoyladenosine biosynthesis protein TsaE